MARRILEVHTSAAPAAAQLVPEARLEHVVSEPPSFSERLRPFIFWTGKNSKSSIERGIKTAFTGLLFLTMALITLFVLPGSGTAWWFWMLILAAFFGMSAGVTEIVKHVSSSQRRPQNRVSAQAAASSARAGRELPAAETNEIVVPPSVTEVTTKQLDGSLPKRDSFQ